MLISRQLPALYNGVSQQPATLRLPSQAEAQVNMYASVVDGLLKRPAFQHVAKLTSADIETAFQHTIDRDTTERYDVVITDGDLKVYDATTGVEKTVTFPEGKTYLNVVGGGDASESFAVVSIADYSFVVNKTKVVAEQAAPSGVPTGFSNWYFPTGWGTDDSANYIVTAQGTFEGDRQTFSELPDLLNSGLGDGGDALDPPDEGDVWKIVGSNADGFGSYYVMRRSGAWHETHAPSEATAFDEQTMPFALVRESDGTFTFRPFAWKPRFVGDVDSNPSPTFVGKTLEDVFYYKNRLGFVAAENTVFSAAGDYGNFFRTTVTDLLDSDVVDVAVSATNVAKLKFAVPFNSGLMLFADQTQFALNIDQVLGPSTVSIDTVTEFEMNTRVRPVGIGSDVYFVTESGSYSRVREYFVREDSNSSAATDITAHVPRYLPKGIFKMAGNSNEDVLFAISDEAGYRNRIYVYRFYWSGQDRLQSAWSYWELAEDDVVLSVEVLENELYAIIKRADGAYLEKCDIQSGAETGSFGFQILLDRLHKLEGVDGTFDSVDTSYTLPYELTAAEQANFKAISRAENGRLLDPDDYTWVNSTTFKTPGDTTGGALWVGLNYEGSWEFSEQFMMNGDKAITTGRLQLRTFTVYFTDTAFFKTEVSPYGTDPIIEDIVPAHLADFTGKTLGEASLIVGDPVFHTGHYSFQVYGNSREAVVKLVNDTHVQSKFQSAEFEALYHNRARST